MKTIKNIIIICCILNFAFCINLIHATVYSWVGNTSTDWATAANWGTSPGVPSTNDTVTITSTGTYQPVLDQNRTVKKFTMTSGTLNLNTYDLTISHTSTFTSGTISNGKIYPTGVQATYSGTTFNCEVNSVTGKVFLNGSTFNYRSYFEDTISTATHYGNGGNTFNAPAVFKKNSVFHWGISNSTGNTFNDSAIFLNIRGNNLVATDQGTTNFNGHIAIGSNAGGDIAFTGTSTLASGKTIGIDATTGFTSGDLRLNNFTQSGSTSQSFTMTGSATLSFYNDTWNGAVSFIAPHVLLKMTTFNSTASFEQTHATIGSNSDGGNTFNGAATLNSSGALLRMGTTYDDTFNSNLTVVGAVNIGTATTTIIKGNLTAAGSSYQFNNGAVSGTLKFAGSNAQHISSGGTGIIGFNKMKIDKTGGSVTLDTTITADDTLTFVSGNIISTSTHLLSMLAGSTVTGANNSSFVSGPVKKTGNTAFVFPTGKSSDYRAVSISAPSSATDAFTGEYLDAGQSLGNTMDGTIKYIHNCGYWNLARNTGSSNVTVSLSWDSAACDLLDSATVKVGNWNGSTWNDLGNGGVTGNKYVGKVANSTTVITWGNFALAYDKCFIAAAAGTDRGFCAGDSTTVGASPVATMGMTPYTYSWSPSSGLSSTSVANPKASPSSTTNYIVSVTDLSGCAIRDTVTVTHHPLTFTWTGAAGTAWENPANWSPAGIPLYCDNVVIVSGSNNVEVNSPVLVTGFTINSGTVDLNSYSLDVTGKAVFNAGTINSGWIYVANTDTASFSGTHFGADVSTVADVILLNGSEFDQIAEFSQQGNSNSTSSGGNVFNFATSVQNTGDGNMYLANSSADIFNDDVAFSMSGDGTIYPAYTKNASFGGNLTLSYHPVPSNGTVVFGANGGKAIFNGDTTQTISYTSSGTAITTNASNTDTMAIFKKMQVNKSDESLILGMSVRVTDSLILTKGNIVSDTTNLLCMRAGSVVTGASDTSLVDGAVKKFGNTSFVFPIGNLIQFRPLEISSPSSSTDAFLAQYFDEAQTVGDSLDTALAEVSSCHYWKVDRKNGSSNVYVSLSWDSSHCWEYDTTQMRMAWWDGYKWKDKGKGLVTGNHFSGKVASSQALSSFGYFTLSKTALLGNVCGTTYESSATTASQVLLDMASFNPNFVIGTSTITTFGPNSAITVSFTSSPITIDIPDFTIQDANLFFDEQVAIFFDTGIQVLTVDNSHLQACKGRDMWSGVDVASNTQTFNLVNNSLIQDADIGITAIFDGVFNVNHSIINRCRIGIQVAGITAYNYPSTFENHSEIKCTQHYSNLVPGVLIPPYNSPPQPTLYGFFVYSTEFIEIGNGATAQNQFFNCVRGIYTEISDLKVQNNLFMGLTNLGDEGIFAYHNISASNPATDYTLECGGDNIFLNLDRGIYALNYNCIITGNNFIDCNNPGIQIGNSFAATQLNPHDISISNNTFDFFNVTGYGIRCNNLELNNYCNISGNEFNLNGSNEAIVGIYVANTPNIHVRNLNIYDNEISNTQHGIYLSGIHSNAVTANNVNEIYDNTIHLNNTLGATNNVYGIRLNGCNRNWITNNTIDRASTGSGEADRVFGIYINQGTNCRIVNNSLETLGSGIALVGSCPATKLCCNTMDGCFQGVRLGLPAGTQATVSHHGTPNKALNNVWLNNINTFGTNGFSTWFNWYFHDPPTSIWDPIPDFSNLVNLNTFSGIDNISCPVIQPLVDMDTVSDLKVYVMDTLTFTDHANENRWYALDYAYRRLADDTMLMHAGRNDDSLYQAFYEFYDTTNIGKFYYLEKLTADTLREDALDLLESIDDTNTVEANLKTVFGIYINSIMNGDTLSESDTSDLSDIAYEASVEGGNGVFIARALLGLIVEEEESGGSPRLAQSFAPPIPGLPNNAVHVYPNPAGNEIYVDLPGDSSPGAVLKIFDITGALLKIVQVHNRHEKINTKQLRDGIYLFNLEVNNSILETGKLVIIK